MGPPPGGSPRPPPRRADVTGSSGIDGAGAAGKGSSRKLNGVSAIKSGRRKARIIDVADDLVHRQARFLKRIQNLGFRLEALLRRTQQREGRSTNDKKDTESGQQFDERKTKLRCSVEDTAHLPTTVSRVTG